jgi:hypothetical protein
MLTSEIVTCDLVDLAKARGYSVICTNIHYMRMNPHSVFSQVEKITQHKTNVNMTMKLKSRDLATNPK